ncbi:MAG TPA: 4'-phosphopantetheinyl transferase superfamily protein [Gemmatimonadales bacterium]|nr:4'-phosphopantetheinyl transferase superfamily protein [Gemmatimonadales bacterium]
MSLGPGEIDVLSFAVDLPPPTISELAALLADDERARADRFRFDRDRGRFIAARGLLRTILGHYADREPRELRFEYGPFGKPELQPEPGGTRLRFNLSCSEGLGVLGIRRDEAIGIDVERLRALDDAPAISRRMFAAEEHAALMARPEPERSRIFFGYWTRKEAVLKSLGVGLSGPMHGFVLPPEPSPTMEPVRVCGEGEAALQWLCPLPAPLPGFVAALATAAEPGGVRCRPWPFS